MVLLHQAVEDRVGNDGVSDPCMPVLDRQLLVMMVALLAARSSMISSRLLRAWVSSAAMPRSSSSSTSVLASWISRLPKVPLPWRMRSSSPSLGMRW